MIKVTHIIHSLYLTVNSCTNFLGKEGEHQGPNIQSRFTTDLLLRERLETKEQCHWLVFI